MYMPARAKALIHLYMWYVNVEMRILTRLK